MAKLQALVQLVGIVWHDDVSKNRGQCHEHNDRRTGCS
jgi:hypothetical protein